MGHAERTCLIGQRLADAVGLESAQRSSLFYALLLKDAGCSTTAAQIATTFGADDQQVKRESRLIDAHRPRTALGYLRRNVAPGAPLRERARHLRAVVAMSHGGVDELERMRCERGPTSRAASASTRTPPPRSASSSSTGTATATRASRRRGDLALARILPVADHGGLLAARRRGRRLRVARARRGTWFDPALVDGLAARRDDDAFWGLSFALHRRLRPGARGPRRGAPTTRAWTASPRRSRRHRRQVAVHRPAFPGRGRAGRAHRPPLDLASDDRRDLRRAGAAARHRQARGLQPHPRQGRPADRHRVGGDEPPPAMSKVILHAVSALAPVGRLSATHHERLDGSGYPYGLTASELKVPDRAACRSPT